MVVRTRGVQEKTVPLADVREWWKLLGAPEKHLELVSSVDPVWDPETQRLVVNELREHDTRGWEKIRFVVSFNRSIINWSDTRWGKCGKGGRLWVRSDTSGLDGLMHHCLNDSTCSNYRISAYDKLDKRTRMLLSVAALGTMATEVFIFKMLEDDRLFLHARETHTDVVAKMEEVAQLPDLVWDRMSTVARCDPGEYMHEALFSQAISYGFLMQEVFEQVNEEPLSLTQGDIDANVAELSERTTVPTNNATARMKKSLDQGMRPARLVSALVDLKEAPMTTELTEEAHAIGAMLRRQRKFLSEKQLRVRCLGTAFLPLVRRKQVNARIKRIDSHLGTLSKKMEWALKGKIHGKHMFFREKVKASMRPGRANATERKNKSEEIMATHNLEYAHLRPLAKLTYTKQAREYDKKKGPSFLQKPCESWRPRSGASSVTMRKAKRHVGLETMCRMHA